jgi:HK97 gp10 family phage protein
MAGPQTITRIRGVAEAKRAFKALPDEVKRIWAVEVTTPTAEAVAARARMAAAAFRDTGTVHDAITVSKGAKTGWAFVRIKKLVRVLPGRGGSARTRAGARKRSARQYARLLEFGTSKMGARPFMRPSLEAELMPAQNRSRAAGQKLEGVFTAMARGSM